MQEATRKYLGETVDVKAAHRFDVARLDAYLAGAIVETIVRLLAGLVARTRAPER